MRHEHVGEQQPCSGNLRKDMNFFLISIIQLENSTSSHDHSENRDVNLSTRGHAALPGNNGYLFPQLFQALSNSSGQVYITAGSERPMRRKMYQKSFENERGSNKQKLKRQLPREKRLNQIMKENCENRPYAFFFRKYRLQ